MTVQKKRLFTLADCAVSHPSNCRCSGGVLRCMHCTHEFPQSSCVEAYANYIVVECMKCRCVTPFRLEKTA
jgi:hypothetical protein